MTTGEHTGTDDIAAWMRAEAGALYVEPPEVTVDREEVVVVGRVSADGAAEARRMAEHREQTRSERIRIARLAEDRFARKVSWGVRCGDATQMFTHLATPVMTRLRQPERLLVDTLVEAGVARSRSEAVAWCLGVVAEREGDWLADLQEALVAVREARGRGPQAGASA